MAFIQLVFPFWQISSCGLTLHCRSNQLIQPPGRNSSQRFGGPDVAAGAHFRSGRDRPDAARYQMADCVWTTLSGDRLRHSLTSDDHRGPEGTQALLYQACQCLGSSMGSYTLQTFQKTFINTKFSTHRDEEVCDRTRLRQKHGAVWRCHRRYRCCWFNTGFGRALPCLPSLTRTPHAAAHARTPTTRLRCHHLRAFIPRTLPLLSLHTFLPARTLLSSAGIPFSLWFSVPPPA